MDRGAWWARVHEVAKSRIPLSTLAHSLSARNTVACVPQEAVLVIGLRVDPCVYVVRILLISFTLCEGKKPL